MSAFHKTETELLPPQEGEEPDLFTSFWRDGRMPATTAECAQVASAYFTDALKAYRTNKPDSETNLLGCTLALMRLHEHANALAAVENANALAWQRITLRLGKGRTIFENLAEAAERINRSTDDSVREVKEAAETAELWCRHRGLDADLDLFAVFADAAPAKTEESAEVS